MLDKLPDKIGSYILKKYQTDYNGIVKIQQTVACEYVSSKNGDWYVILPITNDQGFFVTILRGELDGYYSITKENLEVKSLKELVMYLKNVLK